MGGILVVAMSKVLVRDGLCGTFLRHCNGINNRISSYFGSLDPHLHRINPILTLGLGDRPPFAPDTWILALRRNGRRRRNEREEKSQEYVLL